PIPDYTPMRTTMPVLRPGTALYRRFQRSRHPLTTYPASGWSRICYRWIGRSLTMPRTWSIRLQTALVIALFLASSATVLFSVYQTLLLPQREYEVRDRLREASRQMADAADPELRRF